MDVRNAARAWFWIVLLLAAAGLAGGQSAPVINTEWATTGTNGGALNINVSNLPPNALVEVEVKDISHGNQIEQPVGSPPKQADEKGNWPGEKAGTKTGYPGTASDAGGTKYVVSVKVNGKTGPSREVIKPGRGRSIWSVISSLGGILLTDALGITSRADPYSRGFGRPRRDGTVRCMV